MKRRKRPQRPTEPGRTIRCWDFFRCAPEKQNTCLMGEVGSASCWLVDVACCRMPQDAARPISIKKVICKGCALYIYVHKTASG